MTFEVPAAAYAAFMGRYSSPLAVAFADLVGAHAGQQALDVGCGPGALTEVLVARTGALNIAAVDPSDSFVAAVRARFPDLDVRHARAEALPFTDASFDLTVAQLVVHFMADPCAGLAEMARVTRPAGVVAANVWDHAGGGGPLATFWRAARAIDPHAPDESGLPGVAEGRLAELFAAAGMPGARSTALTVRVDHPTFTDWWEPFTLGVGPAGEHVAGLVPAAREALRRQCEALLPQAPFVVTARAWTVWWVKPGA